MMDIEEAWEIILDSKDVYFRLWGSELDCFPYVPHRSGVVRLNHGIQESHLIFNPERRKAVKIIRTFEKFWHSISPLQREIYFLHYINKKYYPLKFLDTVYCYHFKPFSISRISHILRISERRIRKEIGEIRKRGARFGVF